MKQSDRIRILNLRDDLDVFKALASAQRLQILELLSKETLNINEITEALQVPQSSIATHVAALEKAGLVITETQKARKGSQKRCRTAFSELIITFPEEKYDESSIEVDMPIGLYTNYEVSVPCGLCSTESVIGLLDVADSFLEPERMKAALLWFETGFVEYKFPNNALKMRSPLAKIEISAELSSETPGTNENWPSDITVSINGIEIGVWTSPGDYGDKRGKHTPFWWKLAGSQYGLLKNFSVSAEGSFVDGIKMSSVTLADLKLKKHHSIIVRFEVKSDAAHPGGLNIFGREFGNYNQGILLRLYL